MAAKIISDDITDLVVEKGHGITGLVQKMALEGIVPRQYIQPAGKRFDKNKIIIEKDIQIIDVSNWDDEVSELICDAAEKRGFFQIINHGIPMEVLENVQNAAHRFFGLTTEEKRNYFQKIPYTASSSVFLATSFNPRVDQVLEWKDFLSLQYFQDDDSCYEFWPSMCKNEVMDYIKCLESVIEKLLIVLMKRLNVDEIDQTKRNQLMGTIWINLNYFPICPNPELTFGTSRHCDVSSLTILLQDETGGLYVRGTEGDTWTHVDPVRGSLVINIGDVLQILSNGRYKSIEHYVVPNKSKNRVSVPIFLNATMDSVIAPLPEVLKNGETPLFKEVVFSDYFNYFFSKGHSGIKTIDYVTI